MIMKMENEMKYVAPEVEVLEVAIEKGFAGSGVEIDDTPAWNNSEKETYYY